ncbi:MAG TPA: CheR family methyltransferase [Anaerolineae bacterium]|nr:CheR family methyltransferase [Anaerolineae bacterium]
MTTPTDIDRAILAEAAARLSERAGFRFNLDQPLALWHALGQRARALHLPNRRAYLQHLRREETEWMRLAEEVTVHETSFFRHAGQFRILSDVILPERVRRRAAERKLRVWSAACATGEEPYSLAIAIDRLGLPADWQIEILATDLSTRALETAEEGVYDRRRLRALTPDRLRYYFEPQGERFRLREKIRSRVTFTQFNLTQLEPLPQHLRGMDIVFCENVLIYFLPEAARRTVDHLRTALSEGGYLFLGYAETLYGMAEGFSVMSFGDAYVYRRETGPAAAPPPAPLRASASDSTLARLPSAQRRAAPTPRARKAAQPAPSFLSRLEALIDTGNLAGAMRLAEEWLALEPDSVAARYTLARLYAAHDQDLEATQLLRQSLMHDSLHAPSYVLLGMLCYRQGELEEALAQFQHALYLEPHTPLAYFFLGNIYQQREQIPHAILAYRNAVRAATHIVPAWDSGFTPDVLAQVCERNIARLEKAGK